MPCSRDKSRIVRNIINKRIMPILDRYRVSMPIECPFHPSRDFLWWPESEREADGDEVDDISPWYCPFCDRTFLCAERLAIHWDEEHRPSLDRPEDSVCLADYCDIMRCDVLAESRRKKQKTARSQWQQKGGLTLKQAKATDNGSRSEARSSPPSVQRCNYSSMRQLQARCVSVIQQCTIGLMSTLSSKDFRDIEDDLNRSICSYLTCDKFFDDSLTETRNVPLALCIIIVIIMIGGFCLCYYIVWMLFDSPLRLTHSEQRRALLRRQAAKEDQSYLTKPRPLPRQSQSEPLPYRVTPTSARPKIMTPSPASRFYYHSRPVRQMPSPTTATVPTTSNYHHHYQSTSAAYHDDYDRDSCADDVLHSTASAPPPTARTSGATRPVTTSASVHHHYHQPHHQQPSYQQQAKEAFRSYSSHSNRSYR